MAWCMRDLRKGHHNFTSKYAQTICVCRYCSQSGSLDGLLACNNIPCNISPKYTASNTHTWEQKTKMKRDTLPAVWAMAQSPSFGLAVGRGPIKTRSNQTPLWTSRVCMGPYPASCCRPPNDMKQTLFRQQEQSDIASKPFSEWISGSLKS